MKIRTPKLTVTKGLKRTPSFEVEQLRTYDEKTNTAVFAISSKSVDRHREMVLPSAVIKSWETYYKRNPVVLWSHQKHHPLFFLGRCNKVWLHEDGRPTAEFEFDVSFNDLAALVAKQIEAKTLRMTSIGFLPLKWVSKWDGEEKLRTLPDFAREALENGECWVVHTEIEQVETSVCGIGSNREADNFDREFKELFMKNFGALRPELMKLLGEEASEKMNDDEDDKTTEETSQVESGEEDVEQDEVSTDADSDTPPEPEGDKESPSVKELMALCKALEKRIDEHEEFIVDLLTKSLE